MNAAQANALSLPEILKILGCHLQKTRRHDHLYLSPFRDEKTPSFHVHVRDNVWYDFGAGHGGDVVDFACAYLQSQGFGHSVSEALRFLGDMHPFSLPRRTVKTVEKTQADGPALTVGAVHPLRHPALLQYLTDERMIPLDLARKYLVEVEVRIEWSDDGEEWIRGRAWRWTRSHVFVRFMDQRSLTGFVWVRARDVRRL